MVVGLTGGIGSGKSTISKLFEIIGCAVFESDKVAKEIYFEAETKPKIIDLLGAGVYVNENTLNKRYISSKIFEDTTVLEKLNQIIHPAVIKRSKLFVEKNAGKLIIKETALLFEAHLEKECDKIVVIAANTELRIKRVMQRDGLKREDVLKKIQSQLTQEEKIKRADFVIYNDEESLIIPQVLKIYEQLNTL